MKWSSYRQMVKGDQAPGIKSLSPYRNDLDNEPVVWQQSMNPLVID